MICVSKGLSAGGGTAVGGPDAETSEGAIRRQWEETVRFLQHVLRRVHWLWGRGVIRQLASGRGENRTEGKSKECLDSGNRDRQRQLYRVMNCALFVFGVIRRSELTPATRRELIMGKKVKKEEEEEEEEEARIAKLEEELGSMWPVHLATSEDVAKALEVAVALEDAVAAKNTRRKEEARKAMYYGIFGGVAALPDRGHGCGRVRVTPAAAGVASTVDDEVDSSGY